MEEFALREILVGVEGAFSSFVSLWALRGQRVRERALVHARGKDGGRTSGVEDVPRARPCATRRHVPPGPEGELADLQGSRDFFLSFYLGIECVWCVRPRP